MGSHRVGHNWACMHIMGTLLSHKKNEILPFVTTWMDFEGIMLSVISQTEKNKYRIFALKCEI